MSLRVERDPRRAWNTCAAPAEHACSARARVVRVKRITCEANEKEVLPAKCNRTQILVMIELNAVVSGVVTYKKKKKEKKNVLMNSIVCIPPNSRRNLHKSSVAGTD